MNYNDEMIKCPVCDFDYRKSADQCPCCGTINIVVTVGRENCDINIRDREMKVSRHHIDVRYIQSSGEGFYTITNYGVNCTMVDGKCLAIGESIVFSAQGVLPRVLLACDKHIQLNWRKVKLVVSIRLRNCPRPNSDNNNPYDSDLINCDGCIRETVHCSSKSANNPIIDIVGAFATHFAKVASKVYSAIEAIKIEIKRSKHDYMKYSPTRHITDDNNVYSSIFAPAEIRRKSPMTVQVYIHLFEETEKVKSFALESDKNAERRDYIPLQCKLKNGDKVDVLLNIYGESLLKSEKKSVVWQDSFTKCSFDYFVQKDIDVDELSCVAMLTVNGIPVGEMRFITKIVEQPKQLHPKIIAHKYNKVFISYAHKDEAKVKSFHEGLKLAGIEHFFDRAYLKTGDVFPQVIQDYINSADLFVLFWSKNASMSEYVQKERTQALERAFPQVKPQHEAKLSIYPMSIEPRAELPSDMKDNYHFGEM